MTRDDLQLLLGGRRAASTSCGIVSLSVDQARWAVDTARGVLAPHLADLTDLDLAWLLVNGWDPHAAWEPWIEMETIGGSGAGLWPLVAAVLVVAVVVALLVGV